MKYALLIDSENAEPRMDEIFQELTKYGDTPIRYLVGNFTQNGQNNPWLRICQKHAITCIQTMNFTKGKNSLDISLVIEGMKLLYEKTFIDGIIIIASDSDYTPLAREWRNMGKEVIGIGRKLTKESYRASCTKFIYVENIFQKKEENNEEDNGQATLDKLYEVIQSVLNENNGMAQLSVIVESIRKAYTDFDVRSYGYEKALDFFKASFKTLNVTEEKKNSYFISFKKKEVEEKKKETKKKETKNKTKKTTQKRAVKKNPKKVKEPIKQEVEDNLTID